MIFSIITAESITNVPHAFAQSRSLLGEKMIEYLYLHIPFCVKKCIYCDFFSIPYDEALAYGYVTGVIHELDLRRDLAGSLKAIYVGGGTPTTLPTLSLIRLLRKVKESFRVSPEAEITIEANPGTVSRESVEALADTGINRISLGVQSFDDHELKMLGRMHDFSDVLRSVAVVRHAGITNLSIDLMYGLPGQTQGTWSRHVSKALEIFPEHISAYELTPEQGTPLQEAISRGEVRKPDDDTIVEMYYHAIDRFTEAGCRQYEISNFARSGFECRHNLNYWNRGEYLGIGAGAHSFIGDRRIKNVSNVKKYIESVKGGALPVEEEIEITREDALKEAILLGLRKTEGLEISKVGVDFGVDLLAASEEMTREGLLRAGRGYLALTRKGLVVSNTVIARLFELLEH